MATFTPITSDSFNAAPENPLSNGGVWVGQTGVAATFQRTNSTAIPTDLNNDCARLYTGTTWPNNQYARGTINVTGTAGARAGAGFSLRAASSAATYYRFVIDHAGASNIAIDRFNAGTRTGVTTFTTSFTSGDQFYFAVETLTGTTTLYVFDKTTTQILSAVDTTAITSGNVGIVYSSVETGASIDNWEGGTFATAAGGATFVPPHFWGDLDGLARSFFKDRLAG